MSYPPPPPPHPLCMCLQLMDSLFEATFSPLAQTGKPLSKCGKCSRFMK